MVGKAGQNGTGRLQGLTIGLLTTVSVATRASAKPESQVVAVIKGHGFNGAHHAEDFLVGRNPFLDGDLIPDNHFGGNLLDKEYRPPVLLEKLSEFRRGHGMGRAVSPGTIAKAARNAALERYPVIYWNGFRLDHAGLGSPQFQAL